MRLIIYLFIIMLLSFLFKSCSKENISNETTETIAPNLSDNQASEQTQALYKYLRSVYGKKILSSTMANVNWNTKEAENVYKLTGKYPAMNCFDFIHIHHSPSDWIDYSNITPVKDWANAGGIVSLMWHFYVPTSENSETYTYKSDTKFKIANIFLSNTWESRFFHEQLDKVCSTLLKLQSANIPALWRPFHEASGSWFWWGKEGAEMYVRLWKYTYNYLQNKGIHNLIWVWTTEKSYDYNWYPGDDYVDIIGKDLYGKNASQNHNNWLQIKNSHTKKMISLSECGNLLAGRTIIKKQASIEEQWTNGTRWLYFMPWYDYLFNEGKEAVNVRCSDDFWINAMSQPYVISRQDI
ncbi:glycosyl hydrolase [Capnocytophaga cynodegmi]|uniref:glycosyl hydrolase n=1 Tax=Capnocytophaga cynodegmi TaxID=28189 RepID=UPI0038597015